MLDLEQIAAFYPEALRPFRKNILREYLQYKLLGVIYGSPHGRKLNFMGGTALRILHGHDRFSEDLDFDNLGLGQKDFKALADLIRRKLGLEGYRTETRLVFAAAYSCHVKLPGLPFAMGLSGHEHEKMLIKLDAEPQHHAYRAETPVIGRFDVLVRVRAVPADILLAQKLAAILTRKRAMGRDFYDALFLFGKAAPDEEYLRKKLGVKSLSDLKEKMLARCRSLDFRRLAREIEPLVLSPEDAKKVLYFPEYIKTMPE